MSKKYYNPAINGFDKYGDPIGDPQAIMFYERQNTLRDTYPTKKDLKTYGFNFSKKNYKEPTTQQKKEYAKQFTKKQIDSYQKGKRIGFLKGIHTNKKNK